MLEGRDFDNGLGKASREELNINKNALPESHINGAAEWEDGVRIGRT